MCMHFTSLPSRHGIGDIADASLAFVEQLAEMNIRVWQVLPAGPAGFGDSPYQPLSAFAGNDLLVGLDPLLRQGLLRGDELAELQSLPETRVDYGALIPLKLAALRRAAERFLANTRNRGEGGFEAFLEDNGAAWLDDYALFRVLKDLHGARPWPEWDRPCLRRQPNALRSIANAHRRELELIKVIQYFFDRQWAQLREHCASCGIRLFGDLPFYIGLDSADAWSHPEMFLLEPDGQPSRLAGVPPDYFSEDGQLWGNPLYDWAQQATTGYRWWIERLKQAARRCDMVRVDHFRGFQAFWSVPCGEATARNGEWVEGPGDALFDAMERVIGALPVVAEDLGVITDEVRELRQRHGLPGMRVLQFELADAAFDPRRVPEDCMCWTGTHDNDTTLGWFSWKSGDGRTRKEIRKTRRNALRLTGGKARSIHRDLLRLAFRTRARIAAAPMQDYLGLGSASRLNTPGTSEGNWRWRMVPGQLEPAVRQEIARLVGDSGRG